MKERERGEGEKEEGRGKKEEGGGGEKECSTHYSYIHSLYYIRIIFTL